MIGVIQTEPLLAPRGFALREIWARGEAEIA